MASYQHSRHPFHPMYLSPDSGIEHHSGPEAGASLPASLALTLPTQGTKTEWFPSSPASIHHFVQPSPLRLQLDLGCYYPWCFCTSRSMDDQTVRPATVRPQDLHRRQTDPSLCCENMFSHESAIPSSYQYAEALSYDDFELVLTPENMSREQTAQLTQDDNWSFLKSPVFEYCPSTVTSEPTPRTWTYESFSDLSLPVLPRFDPVGGMHGMLLKDEDEVWQSSFDSTTTSYFAENSQAACSIEDLEDPDFKVEPYRKGRQPTARGHARHTCPACHKVFSRTFNYNAHLDTHTPDIFRPRPYHCSYCQAGFRRPTDLKRHEKSVSRVSFLFCWKFLAEIWQKHSDVRDYYCKHCNKSFSRKDGVNR